MLGVSGKNLDIIITLLLPGIIIMLLLVRYQLAGDRH